MGYNDEKTGMMGTTIVAGLVVGVVLYLWLYRWMQRNRSGLKKWPLLGNYVEMMKNYDRIHDWISDCIQASPTRTIEVKVMGSNLYFTADPDNLEYILKTNWTNYIKGPVLHETVQIFLGDGIFIVDGEKWKVVRKLGSMEFSSKKLRDFSTRVYREHGIRLANILAAADAGKSVDLQDLLLRMSMDSFSKIGFGKDLNNLRADLPRTKFADAFARMSVVIQTRQIGPIWKLKRALNIGTERELKQLRNDLDQYLYEIIDTRKAEMELLKAQGHELEADDLISRFMLYEDEDGKKLSDQWLRDVAMNFMLAGRDTTAGTLSWFIYSLCGKPEVVQRCREEMDRVLGQATGDSISSFAELLTYESVKELHYLHATLTETLRIYPAVANDPKFAAKDDVLPDGTKIKGNSTVNAHPYAMGRLQSLWGPDAEEFKPERWLQDGVFQPESPFKFPAFMAGPRMCMGVQTAYLQMKIVAAILLRFFHFELAPDALVEYNVSLVLTLTMKHGLKVHVARMR